MPSADLSSLRIFGASGEPWDDDAYRWLTQTVGEGRRPLINFSGGTEVGGAFLAPYPVEPLSVCSLGGPSLAIVDGETGWIHIARGTGSVEQNENAEVAGKLAAFQVDVFGRGVAGAQVDEQIDEGFDVEVVAIGPAAKDLGTETQA